jgi:hypothetical protein
MKLSLALMALGLTLVVPGCGGGGGGNEDAQEEDAPDDAEGQDTDDADGTPDVAPDETVDTPADEAADTPQEEVPAVDFDTQVQPLLNVNCIFCHGGSAPRGQLDMTAGSSLDNLVGVMAFGYAPALRVAPGNPGASVFWNKINDTGEYGGVMPPSGELPQDQRDTFAWWILGL